MRRIFTFTLFFKRVFFYLFVTVGNFTMSLLLFVVVMKYLPKMKLLLKNENTAYVLKISWTFFLLEALLGVFMKRPKGRFVSDQVLSKHRSNIIFCLHILNFLSCSFLSDKMDIFERDIFWYCIRKEENRTNLVCVEDPNHFAGFLLGADTEL